MSGYIGLVLLAIAGTQWFGPYRDLPERADRRFRAVLFALAGIVCVAGFWS